MGPPPTHYLLKQNWERKQPAVIKSELLCFTKIEERRPHSVGALGRFHGPPGWGGRPPARRALLGGDPGGHNTPGASGKTWDYFKQF